MLDRHGLELGHQPTVQRSRCQGSASVSAPGVRWIGGSVDRRAVRGRPLPLVLAPHRPRLPCCLLPLLRGGLLLCRGLSRHSGFFPGNRHAKAGVILLPSSCLGPGVAPLGGLVSAAALVVPTILGGRLVASRRHGGRSAPTGSHHRPGAPGVTESVSCIALSSEYPRRPRPAVGDRLDRRQDRRPARRHRTDRVGPDLRRVKRSVGGSEESEPLRRPACPCCPAAPISAGYLCRTNRGASCETTVREPTLRALAERALASRRGHSVQESCRGGA